MINFGPATITWESASLLANSDFELWSPGNNNYAPLNWNASAGNFTILSSNVQHGYLAAQISYNGSMNLSQNVVSPTTFRGKTVTINGYAKANAANAVRLRVADDAGNNTSNNYSGNNNWQQLSVSRTIDNNANNITVTWVGSNNFAVDFMSFSHNNIALGKTFGGGSLSFKEHSFVGQRTRDVTSYIYGGEGVIHMFQWNNTFTITDTTALFNYGKLTIACNNMTIVLDYCKLFFRDSFSFGTYQQQPLDLALSFRKSPITGNVITIS